MCESCIYRMCSKEELARLEAQVASPVCEGFFDSYRACHSGPHDGGVCCFGFWKRHKNHFTLGVLAQLWDIVVYVHINTLERWSRGRQT